jgi:excisionase family DNA binding protein
MNEIVTNWMTVREAAVYTRCGVKTLYRAIHAGQIRAARIGGRRKIVVKKEWLDAYLEAMADRAQPAPYLRRVA